MDSARRDGLGIGLGKKGWKILLNILKINKVNKVYFQGVTHA